MAKRAPKKKAYHHGDLRRALIDAALEMIARDGTGVVALRELAERVGVSHAAPYRHFKSREALFDAVAEEGFRQFRSEMIEARDAAGNDARERLIATGVAYVKFAVSHPGHIKVMFSALGQSLHDSAKPMVEGADAFQVLLNGIIEAQKAGYVRPGDPLEHAVSAWSSVHGLSMLLIENCLGPFGAASPPEQLARRMLEDVMRGAGK